MLSRIWIIDDDKIFRYTSERYLLEINPELEIHTFKDAEEAFQQLRSQEPERWPHVIFIDLNLPVFDGWDFLENIKRNFGADVKQILFYVVSSSVDPRDLERTAGYDFIRGYKVKPLSIEDFSETIS